MNTIDQWVFCLSNFSGLNFYYSLCSANYHSVLFVNVLHSLDDGTSVSNFDNYKSIKKYQSRLDNINNVYIIPYEKQKILQILISESW